MTRVVPILRTATERNASTVLLRGNAIPIMWQNGPEAGRNRIMMSDFEAVSENDLCTFLSELGMSLDSRPARGRLGSSFSVTARYAAGFIDVDIRCLDQHLADHGGPAEYGGAPMQATRPALPPTAIAQENS